MGVRVLQFFRHGGFKNFDISWLRPLEVKKKLAMYVKLHNLIFFEILTFKGLKRPFFKEIAEKYFNILEKKRRDEQKWLFRPLKVKIWKKFIK